MVLRLSRVWSFAFSWEVGKTKCHHSESRLQHQSCRVIVAGKLNGCFVYGLRVMFWKGSRSHDVPGRGEEMSSS